MRLILAAVLLLLLAACNPRGAGNHENVGDNAPWLKEMADAGFDMSAQQAITFSVVVPSEQDADGLVDTLARKGYVMDSWENDGDIWAVTATKTLVPTLANVDATEKEVVAASDQYRGYYAGWDYEEEEEFSDEELDAEINAVVDEEAE